MSHKNKESLTRQIEKVYKSKLALGRSKYNDQQEEQKQGLSKHEITSQYIYSISTMKAYLKHMNYFANYCKENYKCKTLEQCKQYIDEYISKEQESKSPYTVKLEVSAICKCYNMKTEEVIKTNERNRSNITRSRKETNMDKHFSKTRNKDLIDFCLGTGLRRNEVEHIKGTDIKYINGEPFIIVQSGKGGKQRFVEITSNKEQILDMMSKAENNKVFGKANCKADIHGFRSEYATELYKQLARPIDQIPRAERYYCRGDKKGIVYDRVAMLRVSNNLGHNRVNVIASHYLN